ncbi:nucleotidyltransferase [Glycocaulis albus]|jgi:predicted nucleotidyltransferase|uniref:Nucleotidyltransferase n=1 Tax=Glycocaulis albus TaxID=1382801 RepID=A0ABQ1XTW6_9PROT|nr:nucleotidyltransferase family protein [Glycocaulis albus]GGH03078.1 nucleotidyltransferase [Glycocaulis albus]
MAAMKRDELLARLRELKPWFEDHGIIRVRVFGSHARDEAGPDSDVDLLVEFAQTPSLIGMIGIERSLANELGCPVDLATEHGLKPRARAHIAAEAVDA